MKVRIDTSDAERKLKAFLEERKLLAQEHLKEVSSGVVEVVEHTLENSYVRSKWVRTGLLEKAVAGANEITLNRAGIGNISTLDREAFYWRDVEEGTEKYVGEEFYGFFRSASGQRTRPSGKRYPQDRWEMLTA